MVELFTSVDVARLAGVSQSTVSYVMSGKRPISEKTRRRVEDAMAELTYQPNAGARALAGQRTHVVGLVVPFGPSADTVGVLPFIETITSSVREHDYDVLLVTADEGVAALTRLTGRSLVDAILLMGIEAADERIAAAAQLRLPVILIGVPDDPRGLPCVDLDLEAAGRLAVEELARSGHREVVLLGHSADDVARDLNFVRRFQRGVVGAAEARDLALRVVSPVEHDRASVDAAVDAALSAGDGPSGLVVPQQAVVSLVLRSLSGRGCVPGRDVSVVALSTDADARATEPQVTNVSLEPRDVSRRAVRTLFQLLEPGRPAAPGQFQLVAPRLTRRATTVVHA